LLKEANHTSTTLILEVAIATSRIRVVEV